MSDVNPGLDPGVGSIEPDAVCGQCGVVNPEGTLLCKGCGNNLREQRKQRIADPVHPDALAGGRTSRRRMLSIGFSALGFLLVAWTVLNVGRLEEWLVTAQVREENAADAFWHGEKGAQFDVLVRELQARTVSEEEIERAKSNPYVGSDIGGHYFFQYGGGYRNVATGHAFVSEENGRFRFVVKLADIELRGEGRLEADGRPTARRSVAVRRGSEFVHASGFAARQPDGTFSCFGLTATDSTRTYETLAYRIP